MPRTSVLLTSLAVAGGLCAGVAAHAQQVGADNLTSRSLALPGLPDQLAFADKPADAAPSVKPLLTGLVPDTTPTTAAPTTTTPPATTAPPATTTTPPTEPPTPPTTEAPPPPTTVPRDTVPPTPVTQAAAPAEPTPPPAPPAPLPTVPAPAVAGSFDAASEAAFLSLTNQARAAVGVAPLQLDAGLSAYARNHAQEMAAAGRIYHSNISSLLGSWSLVGENVGVGPSVNAIQNALMASPGHYHNLSDAAFTSVGIAVFVDSAGRMYTAHVFAS